LTLSCCLTKTAVTMPGSVTPITMLSLEGSTSPDAAMPFSNGLRTGSAISGGMGCGATLR